jgi:hypothetical protein
MFSLADGVTHLDHRAVVLDRAQLLQQAEALAADLEVSFGDQSPEQAARLPRPIWQRDAQARGRSTAAEQERSSSVITQWRHHQVRDTGVERRLD